MLTSFGEEIAQTPLQLAALMSALANGGTLYYLQYPRTAAGSPRASCRASSASWISATVIPEVKPGMRAAVEYGTAHRAQQDEPIAGKTGTCTESHTHLGWFGSFNDVGDRKLVVVVLLTGGRMPAIGPLAAGVAGEVYRSLAAENYFAERKAPIRAGQAEFQRLGGLLGELLNQILSQPPIHRSEMYSIAATCP